MNDVQITAVPSGHLSFYYDIVCESVCWLEVYDGITLIAGSWLVDSGVNLKQEGIPLSHGPHNLTFTFTQIIGTAGDHAKIHVRIFCFFFCAT